MTSTSLRQRIAGGMTLVALAASSGCGGSHADAGKVHTTNGLTASGTVLRLGQTAIVPNDLHSLRLAVKVTSIEKGGPDGLRDGHLKHPERYTPYYVRYTMRLVSGDKQEFSMDGALNAWSGNKWQPQLTAMFFPPCAEHGLPYGPPTGTTVTSCMTFLVKDGTAPIDRVQYDWDTGEVSWK